MAFICCGWYGDHDPACAGFVIEFTGAGLTPASTYVDVIRRAEAEIWDTLSLPVVGLSGGPGTAARNVARHLMGDE